MFILKLLFVFWALQIILILAFMRGARGPVVTPPDEAVAPVSVFERTTAYR